MTICQQQLGFRFFFFHTEYLGVSPLGAEHDHAVDLQETLDHVEGLSHAQSELDDIDSEHSITFVHHNGHAHKKSYHQTRRRE
jgi:hypothetical protein